MTATIDAAPETRLPDLIALAQEESSEKRRALLRELTDCFFGAAPPRNDGEQQLYGDVLAELSTEMELAVRAELAERFAAAPNAPVHLIRTLALDEAEVAAVPGEAFGPSGYLRFSYALGDDAIREGIGRLQQLFG